MPAADANTRWTLLAEVRTLLQSPGGADAGDISALLKQMDCESINASETAAGDTILHVAARTSDLDVVKLLLAAGADPLIRNAKGRTPGKQLYVEDDVRTELEAAAARQQAEKDAARSAVWGGAVQRTQTESAFGVQTL